MPKIHVEKCHSYTAFEVQGCGEDAEEGDAFDTETKRKKRKDYRTTIVGRNTNEGICRTDIDPVLRTNFSICLFFSRR